MMLKISQFEKVLTVNSYHGDTVNTGEQDFSL